MKAKKPDCGCKRKRCKYPRLVEGTAKLLARSNDLENMNAELKMFLDEALRIHFEDCEVRSWSTKLGFGPPPRCVCGEED